MVWPTLGSRTAKEQEQEPTDQWRRSWALPNFVVWHRQLMVDN